MKIKTQRYFHSAETNTCRNCGHIYNGKICSQCGEKSFNEDQLSTKHFLHQIFDFFAHFESKVLKTIWLNIRKPGFITQQNLKGIRIPYANPIQLYLVVSVLFYFAVTKIGVTDYTPSEYDHYYYPISGYLPFKWAKPIDESVVNYIDTIRNRKLRDIQDEVINQDYSYFDKYDSAKKSFLIFASDGKDSTYIEPQQLNSITGNEAQMIFHHSFKTSVSTYSKTLIFITLPFIAAFFFIFLFRSLKFFGSALILATHFMVYNLCFFIFHCLVDWLPYKIFGSGFRGVLFKPFDFLFWNEDVAAVTRFIFGGQFEIIHLVFWMPWLYIALKRLFNKPGWITLLLSYFYSRVFFYILFGILKKFMIAFTIWTMH